jgi:hypothetical protein
LVLIALGLACAAFATVVYLTLESDHGRFVYRISLALLFFAVSTVSGLIFTTNANFTGDIKGVSMAVGGPAALWIIALVIFAYFYPEKDLDMATLQVFSDNAWHTMRANGWHDYAEWKKGLEQRFSDVLGEDQSSILASLLWSVDYRRPGQKLEHAETDTVFLYFGQKYTMKLQRITGNAAGSSFDLYSRAETSNDTGTANSVILVGSGDGSGTPRVEKAFVDNESVHTIRQTHVDCLIVSWYTDQITRDGDYLVLDMKQYATDHHGSVRLGVAAFKPIQSIQSWYLRSRTTTDQDDSLPLAFKESGRKSQNDFTRVEGDLLPWLQRLDEVIQPGNGQITEEARNMLQKAFDDASQAINPNGPKITPSKILTDPGLKDRHSVSISDAEDVMLSLFLWKE